MISSSPARLRLRALRTACLLSCLLFISPTVFAQASKANQRVTVQKNITTPVAKITKPVVATKAAAKPRSSRTGVAPPRTSGSAVANPYRLVIPSIGLNARVEDVGILPDGKLDTPDDIRKVGWYQKGPKPGLAGNAVIDGHLDIGKKPGVFWHLNKVKPGQVMYVIDEKGQRIAFRVKERQIYHVSEAPLQKIFGKSDGRNLNLITCAGTWDKKLNHYDKRLIVYTERIDTSVMLAIN